MLSSYRIGRYVNRAGCCENAVGLEMHDFSEVAGLLSGS